MFNIVKLSRANCSRNRCLTVGRLLHRFIIIHIAFPRRYDYEFICISFSLIVSLPFTHRRTMFACCRKRSVVVIETRVNKRDSQSILAEKVFLFLERRFASADANFTRLFIPVRLFITEDCGVTYLTYFIIVSRIRSEGRQPRPRLILPRILRQVEKCRGEKTR